MKSAMSKTSKSTFSLQNSSFRFKFFFDQNLDFVLGNVPAAYGGRMAFANPYDQWMNPLSAQGQAMAQAQAPG